MKALNQKQILTTQSTKMNKPKRQQSKVIQKLQQYRSATEFEKTKKQMMLAAKIQDAIKAKELNNTQFAEIMDQHPSVISKLVSGKHNFTTDTLFDIEEKLCICLVSVIDVHRPVIVKQYYSVVKNRNAVKWDGFHGKGPAAAVGVSVVPARLH